jgi:hypothetical protein
VSSIVEFYTWKYEVQTSNSNSFKHLNLENGNGGKRKRKKKKRIETLHGPTSFILAHYPISSSAARLLNKRRGADHLGPLPNLHHARPTERPPTERACSPVTDTARGHISLLLPSRARMSG